VNSTLQIPFRRQLVGFWSWWTGELVALLPESMRGALLGGQRLFLEMDQETLVVSRISSGAGLELGRQHLTPEGGLQGDLAKLLHGARELVFCLPRQQVLYKTVDLPLAAEENLRQVLTFEMGRLTPFKADQVYFDCSVLSRDRNKKSLQVQLILAPRREIDSQLERLQRFGIQLDRMTHNCGMTGEYDPVNLLPEERRARRGGTLVGVVNLLLGVVVLLLLLGVIALPIWAKYERVKTLEPQVAVAAEAASEAGRLRDELDRLKQSSGFLVKKKRDSLLVLQLLDELTRLLPDDTWLSHLELKGKEVQIRGQSMASAALIPIIESSPVLHNARFRSPVTQNRQTHFERFHISAEIEAGSGDG